MSIKYAIHENRNEGATIEFAEPTEVQLIDEVLDRDKGLPVQSVSFIARELRAVMQDRAAIVSRLRKDLENPWLVCPYCMAAVYLVSNVERRFFFRHRHEDQDCPKKSGPGLSQEVLDALRYNGAKESLAHQRVKEIVRQSLLADSRFSVPEAVCVKVVVASTVTLLCCGLLFVPAPD